MLDSQGYKSPKTQQTVGAPQEIRLPASEQRNSKPFPISQKRKRIDDNGGLPFGEPFIIQAHPSFSSPKSQALKPILLLPRSCLSLGYLDPTAEEGNGSVSELFSANIEVLERDAPGDVSIPSTLLIVQSPATHRLWAVERIAPLLYSLCRLNALVTLEALENLGGILMGNEDAQKGQISVQALPLDEEWWHSAIIRPRAGRQGSLSNETNIESTTGLSLCLQKPTQGWLPQDFGLRQSPPTVIVAAKDDSESITGNPSQRPEDVLEMVRSHYQEALYASQTPLAYFAKGPLSRARALFQSYDASVSDQSILVNFLRSSILTLAMMDTKYRESLPNLVKDLPFTALSSDECASVAAAMGKKTRKSKKSTVGKNGLYAGEEFSITQWWLSSDKSAIAGEPADLHDGVIRRLLLEQRIRETQLQVILVLETLALEASATETIPICIPSTVPPLEGSDSQKKSKKPKKPQNLETLLDLLIDRLCIWQSMDTFEAKQTNTEESLSSEERTKTTSKAARNDHLRQFCVDVVLPFYGARIPKVTTALCQKLGGPKEPSPKRPTLMKAATAYAPPRSGAPTQRERGRRPRRTLERVMTDERSTTQRPPPSLSRSVTEPSLPQLKRETSDTSLLAIPLNRVAMHKRYSQREVDLHAASQATETKLKQKAKVEQELHSAIAALKKPNPRMAVKELVEDAEKRVAGARSRKSKNPVRNPFAQGVQVMATPSRQRHQDVFAKLPRLPRAHVAGRVASQVDEVPPSSASKITDSAEKARNSSDLTSDCSHPRHKGNLPAIEQTPSRGPSKLSGRFPNVAVSLIGDHDTSVGYYERAEAGSKSRKAVEDFSSKSSSSNTLGTPLKARTAKSNQATVQATPDKVIDSAGSSKVLPAVALASTTSRAQGESIYASLGWDDDFDELS